MQQQGTVKTVTDRGFGFIEVEGSKDVFYHESKLPMGVKLSVGDVVTFDVVETDRGLNAENIELVN